MGTWICGSVAVLSIAEDAGLRDDAFMLTEFAAIMWPVSLPLLGAVIGILWAVNKIKGK